MALLTPRVPVRTLPRWLVMLAGLTVQSAVPARAQQTPGELEQQIKAAYLLNFTRYVDWPSRAFAGPEAPVNLCVVEPGSLADVARRTVEGHRSRNRLVRVLTPDTPEQARGCHVAFLGGPDAQVRPWLAALRNAPTLVVGDGTGFLARGGAVAFVLVEETVRFEIDQRAVRRAGLQISSRVLALATRLHGEGEDR